MLLVGLVIVGLVIVGLASSILASRVFSVEGSNYYVSIKLN